MANKQELQLNDHMAKFVYNPLAFVYYIFPWGEKGTSLAEYDGPDEWQKDILREVGKQAQTGQPIRIAVRSGHGPGKSALLVWIAYWFISTRPHPQVIVTANTATQLETKTWRELAKWHKLALNKHWFTWTATKFYHNDHKETWFASAITWNKDKPESFAGTHEKHVLMIFDESAHIPKEIWDVAEGAMTSKGAMWFVFGNPTRNSGKFFDCFHSQKHRWITREIDSRTAKMTNKQQLNEWIEDYGIDSDFVRVRVLGKEPRSGTTQFFSGELVDEAMSRQLDKKIYQGAPKILSVDVARFGDDTSVIWRRQGLFSEIAKRISNNNLMDLADAVSREIDVYNPDGKFVDEVGLGAGVIDRLNQLNRKVIGVNGSRKAREHTKFSNKRAEMYNSLKDWMELGGSLPNDEALKKQMTSIEFGHDGKDRIQLERKKDFKSRLGRSPDELDGLVYSWAENVVVRYESDRSKYRDTGFTSWMAA